MTAAEAAEQDAQVTRPSNRKETEKAQKEAEKAERHRKVAQAAVRAQAALECAQEAEEAVAGIELEDEIARPTEVTVEDIERDTGLHGSTQPSGESLKRRRTWLW